MNIMVFFFFFFCSKVVIRIGVVILHTHNAILYHLVNNNIFIYLILGKIKKIKLFKITFLFLKQLLVNNQTSDWK